MGEKYPHLTIWAQERNIPRRLSPWSPLLVDVELNFESFEVLTVDVARCSKTLWPKNRQNKGYLHYWQSYWVKKGAKMSGRNPFNWFFRFPARPCGFRASRNKKWSKFRLFPCFLALFERFFDSNTPVTTWSRMGPRNSIRGAHSRNFGTLYNPVALSIVIWIKSKLLLPQWPTI